MKKSIISLTLVLMLILSCMPTTIIAGAQDTGAAQNYAEDFEGLSTSATPQEIADATGLRFGTDWMGTGSYGIVEENGTKKLQLNCPYDSYGTGIDVFYDFDAPVTTGTIETKIKMGTESINNGSHSIMGLVNGTEIRSLLEAVYAWIYYPEADGVVTRTETNTVLETNPESGMYELRTVVSRNSTDEDWSANVYNDSGSMPVLLYSTKISSASLTQVTSIKLLGTWSLVPLQTVTLDDVSVTYTEPSDEPGEDVDPLSFEGLSIFSTPQEIADATGLRFVTDWMGTGSYNIIEENGSKKLQINSPYDVYGTGIEVFYDFEAPITEGTIETKLKMGTNGIHTGSHSLMGVANGTEIRSLLEAVGKWVYYPEVNGEVARTETDVVIEPNSVSGMYELRTVVSRNSAEEDWTASVYNDGGNTTTLLYSTKISSASLSQVTSVKLLGTWSLAPMQTVTLDDVSVTYTEPSDEPAEDVDPLSFEGLSPAATPQEIADATGLRFVTDWMGTGSYNIIEENGSKKLQLNCPYDSYGTGIDVFYDFDAPITEGTIETKLKMGTNGIHTGSHSLMGVANGTEIRSLLEAVGKWVYYPEVNGEVARTETDVVIEPNSVSGMYELRTVVSRNSAEEDWTASVYNDGGNTTTLLYSTKISSASLTQVTSVKLLGTWSLVPLQTVTLDDITVTYTEPSDEPTEDIDPLSFEGLSIFSTPQEIADATGLRFGTDWMGAGSYNIIEENGTKKLQINSPYEAATWGTGIDVFYDFEAPVTTGTIETKLKMGTNGLHTGSHNLMGLANGTEIRSLIDAAGKWSYYPEVDGVATRTETDVVIEPDSVSGMYELRTVVSRKNTSDDWKVVVYDDKTVAPVVLYTITISASNLPQITSIKLLGTWSMAPMQTVTLDDVKVTYHEDADDQKVTFIQKGDYNVLTKSVSFDVSEALDSSTVIPSNIILKDSANTAFAVENATYANGVLTITTEQSLSEGEYTLGFSNVLTVYGTAVTGEVVFESVVPEGVNFGVTNAVAGANSLSVTVNVINSENTQEPFALVLAAYDVESGAMLGAVSLDKQVTNTDRTAKNVTLTLNGVAKADGLVCKVFFLDSLDNLKPLRVPEVLSAVQFQ